MNCEMLDKCPFYNDKMPMEKGIGAVIKKKYCLDKKENCARYMVLTQVGSSFVSINLYPNMTDIAMDIITHAKK